MSIRSGMETRTGARASTQFVHVARQPLYDRDSEIAGYELLFRGSAQAQTANVAAGRAAGTSASSQVIVTAFTQFGLRQLVGHRPGFVNLTRDFLVGDLAVPFEPDQAVLEVLESVEVDDRVIAGVTSLAEAGYEIALDDFEWGSGHEALLPMAHYVKLEVAGIVPATVAEAVRACRHYPVRLVAERLESAADLELARQLGFDLFQGYLLGRPQVLSAAALSPSRLRRLELLGYLSEPEVNLDRVTSVVAIDPALSYQMLRAASSAAAGRRTPVASVQEAMVLIGTERLVQWLSLLAISDLTTPTEDHLVPILARARLCQVLAEQAGLSASAAFTAGMLVGVSDLLGVPIAKLTAQLPLTGEMSAALVSGVGRLGGILTAVRMYEQGRQPELPSVRGLNLAHNYLSTLDWAMRTYHALLGQPA
jgi:c-di-GMP-related signal transduction protein